MNETKISKFLSYVLRHNPQDIGLTLDREGWADIQHLLSCAETQGYIFSKQQLQDVVINNDKKRFQISLDGQFIRAVQGHSTASVQRQFEQKQPPDILYHGTADRFITSIQHQGLIAGQRHHVHLSQDDKTALAVGQRYGKPYLLTIHAKQMYLDGFTFYLAENQVWLVDHIPVQYIDFA